MLAVGLVLAMSLAAAEAESEPPAAEAENATEAPVAEAEGGTDAPAAEPDVPETQPPQSEPPVAAGGPAAPAETEAVEGEPVTSPAEAEAVVAEPAAQPVPVKLDSELEQRIKASRRKHAEDAILTKSDGADYGDPGADATFVGAERPAVLRPRWPGGALALGAFVGFGAGYYYAGVPRWGLVFTLVDAVLVGGFVASTVLLNNLVIEHDFNQGRSLARNERDFTKREQRWYTASILFALAGVGARAFQAFGGLRAARRTNATLESFSFVPLGDGGALELQLSW